MRRVVADEDLRRAYLYTIVVLESLAYNRRMKLTGFSIVVTLLLASTAVSLPVQQDVKGSSDHPLFPNRMPGYSISNYQQQEFSSYKFRTRPPQAVEGKYTRIHYYLKDVKQHPGGLAIRRNYENAINSVGGQILHSDDNVSVMKATRNGVEVWVELQASTSYAGRYYFLHIVEREAMRQFITADAMAAAIDKDGFIALDIRFATGKAEILPESRPIIDEIVSLLKKRPALRVGVEGHTDNTGTAALNKTLSESRAKAVAAAVVAAGISASRLEAAGFGQERPVADNRTEEGRAKNRRVEIVKR
jgi:outer membrane protein OmpA-like peptidoglycan-associated protein